MQIHADRVKCMRTLNFFFSRNDMLRAENKMEENKVILGLQK